MKKPRKTQRAVSEIISTIILASVVIMVSLIVFYYAMYAFQTSSASTEFGYVKSIMLDIASNFNHIVSGGQYFSSIPSRVVGAGFNITKEFELHIGVPANNITITITNNGAIDLSNVTIEIKLDSTNFYGWNYLTITNGVTDFIFIDQKYNKLEFMVTRYDPIAKQMDLWLRLEHISAYSTVLIRMYYGKYVIGYNSTIAPLVVQPSISVNVIPTNATNSICPIYTEQYTSIYFASYHAFTTERQIIYGNDSFIVPDVRLIPRVVQYYHNGATYVSLDTFRYTVYVEEAVSLSGQQYIVHVMGAVLYPKVVSSSPSQIIVSSAGTIFRYYKENVTNFWLFATEDNRVLWIINASSIIPGYIVGTSKPFTLIINIVGVNVVYI